MARNVRSLGCRKGCQARFVRMALALAFVLCASLVVPCHLPTSTDVVHAQERKKKTGLKWKDYRDPEKATIDYDPEIHRTLSKEFIEWDMKGSWYPRDCPILQEEPDLPDKILYIGEEVKVDPSLIVFLFSVFSQYGKAEPWSIVKSPMSQLAPQNTPEEKVYNHPVKGRLIKFDAWAEGIEAAFEPMAKNVRLTDALKPHEKALKSWCTTIRQMQALDEILDKKTKKGKEYDVRLWKSLWDEVKKKIK
ncbi:MAG: hypothetical protein AB1696_06190 [Planctomycetota bacterium]